jgi:hypothetical protein
MIGVITYSNITKHLLKGYLREYEIRELEHDAENFSRCELLIIDLLKLETVWELCEKVKQLPWDLPILLIISDYKLENIKKFNEFNPNNNIVQKPFNQLKLLEKVKHTIGDR